MKIKSQELFFQVLTINNDNYVFTKNNLLSPYVGKRIFTSLFNLAVKAINDMSPIGNLSSRGNNKLYPSI